MTSSTTVAGLAALLLGVLVSLFLVRLNHLAQLEAQHEAVASLHQVGEDLKTTQFLLSAADADRQQREEALALGRRVLERYRVLESPAWHQTASVRLLAPVDQQRLREDMGELLLLLAWATARQGETPESATRQDHLALALRLNTLAEGCYPLDTGPRALWQQRAELTRLAGRSEEAQRLLERAETIPLRTARDRYLLLMDQLDQGRLRAALPFLREASRQDSNNSSVWLILGNCYAGLGKPADALACYDLGIALWPKGHWAYFRRGVVHLEQKDYRQAQADFDEVIRLRSDLREAYFNRAKTRLALGVTAGARADLTHILEKGPPQLRVYFARARVREKEGDVEGARRDREEGLRQDPLDEQDWTVRGLARQPGNPQAALADFDQALQLNPRYRAALQNKANVLSEQLGRTEEAVRVLDQVLAVYPDYVPARAGRGVLLARLRQREAAHRDAHETLERDRQPFTLYQVAGIYALTSRQESEDRREAFRLLAAALREGTGLDLIDRDRDLDPIRKQPEFRSLVEAARALRAGASPQ